MIIYDLIDKDLKDYYISAQKWMFIISGIISIILGVLSIYFIAALILFVMFLFITLLFIVFWNINKNKYGKKISINDGIIKIYNYKNILIKEYIIESNKFCYIDIAFDYYRKFIYKNCLVLYNDIDLYDKMEYRSYWNESTMIIIENPQTIKEINKILK